jgi:hypothetical protein
MFAGKTGAYQVLYSRVSFWPSLKQETRLERLAKEKHFSLLLKFVNYRQKSFKSLAP